jgi:cadmium resistance protein CadD (predicted permease)
VLLSPFVAYAAGALAILVILRLLFARLRIARYVANPPLAEAGLYVCILALLIVFL